MKPLPKFMPPWTTFLEVLLKLRACIQAVENKSDATKVVETQNVLIEIEGQLRQLKLKPPPLQSDFQVYWKAFAEWVLHIPDMTWLKTT